MGMAMYRLRLKDGRWVNVTASVTFTLGQPQVDIECVVDEGGQEIGLRSLVGAVRRRLAEDVVAADSVVRDVGSIVCKHGRHLVYEFCVKCLAEAKASP